MPASFQQLNEYTWARNMNEIFDVSSSSITRKCILNANINYANFYFSQLSPSLKFIRI